jgi:hypothetical protein
VVVQRTIVLLTFDPRVVAALHAHRGLPWLRDDEAALLLRVDARAFRTDPLREARLFAALLEELPVSCAIAGVDVARGFFRSQPFQHAILTDRLVVDAFGDWLLPRAGGTAQLEQAIALARRRRPRRWHGGPDEWARAPGVELARVPAGTLASFASARASLTAQAGVHGTVHELVAGGVRVATPDDGPGLEHVLVVDVAGSTHQDGGAGPSCATCADALFALLSFARDGRSRAALEDEARRLGADDEAAALIDDLAGEGLLARGV